MEDSAVTLALAATLGVCQLPAVSMADRLLRVAAAFMLPQERVLPGIGTFTFTVRKSTPIGMAIAATVAEAMAILFTAIPSTVTPIPIGGGIHLLMMETRIANEL
jgi:hypothetical protein